MLRTLTTLEAQRKQAVQDLDILVDKKRESLRDPVLFAQKLQKRVSQKCYFFSELVKGEEDRVGNRHMKSEVLHGKFRTDIGDKLMMRPPPAVELNKTR